MPVRLASEAKIKTIRSSAPLSSLFLPNILAFLWSIHQLYTFATFELVPIPSIIGFADTGRKLAETDRKLAETDRKQTIGNNVMIIAATADPDPDRLLALWSQLECWSQSYSKIIISAPLNTSQIEAMENFTSLVASELGTTYNKIQVQHYTNDRYDAGLWCDALETLLLDGLQFDNYFLVNDSLMALRESDEFLSAIRGGDLDLVSLNYWKYDEEGMGNKTWLESPLRAFSAEGIEIFSENICSKQLFNLKCNHLKGRHKKRCIVQKTETKVASFYDPDRIKGLYPGEVDSKYRQSRFRLIHPSWTTNYEYWKNELIDKMNFPAVKVSRGNLDMIHCDHPEFDFASLFACSKKYPNTPTRLLEPCKTDS